MTASATTESDRLSLGPHGEIRRSELEFTFTRSGGPGGQNVNKVATRATLRFNVAGSSSLSAAQKTTILAKLAGRIDAEGCLRVTSSRHRTQLRNRAAAEARLVELLSAALHRDPVRVATRVSTAQKRARREGKARRGIVKERRRRVRDDE